MKMNSMGNAGPSSDTEQIAMCATSEMADCPHMHEGNVISMTGDTLTTSSDAGKQLCYTVDHDAKVTCDGQPSKTTDLTPGVHVLVTTHQEDKTRAIAIEFGKKHPTTVHKA